MRARHFVPPSEQSQEIHQSEELSKTKAQKQIDGDDRTDRLIKQRGKDSPESVAGELKEKSYLKEYQKEEAEGRFEMEASIKLSKKRRKGVGFLDRLFGSRKHSGAKSSISKETSGNGEQDILGSNRRQSEEIAKEISSLNKHGIVERIPDLFPPAAEQPVDVIEEPYLKVDHPKETFRVLYEEGISEEAWERHMEGRKSIL